MTRTYVQLRSLTINKVKRIAGAFCILKMMLGPINVIEPNELKDANI